MDIILVIALIGSFFLLGGWAGIECYRRTGGK
jgi:hypothetical protein